MSQRISEGSFEEAIEGRPLGHGPDRSGGGAEAARACGDDVRDRPRVRRAQPGGRLSPTRGWAAPPHGRRAG